MLVLTRRTNQSIMINDDIEVTVVEVRGDQVRIGINAPKDVSVDRKEIAEQKAMQKPLANKAEGKKEE